MRLTDRQWEWAIVAGTLLFWGAAWLASDRDDHHRQAVRNAPAELVQPVAANH